MVLSTPPRVNEYEAKNLAVVYPAVGSLFAEHAILIGYDLRAAADLERILLIGQAAENTRTAECEAADRRILQLALHPVVGDFGGQLVRQLDVGVRFDAGQHAVGGDVLHHGEFVFDLARRLPEDVVRDVVAEVR